MQKIVTKKGVLRFGNKTNVFSNDLCKKIRAKLNLTKRQLSNQDIYKVIKMSNLEIGNWMIDNADGFKMYKNMGYLSVSKYLPLALNPDKEDIIEKIKASSLPEFLKKRILTKYERQARYLNLNHYMNYYRIMWFNRKNCSSKKADVYRFEVAKSLKNKLVEQVKRGKQYDSFTFEDFYSSKVNPEI